MSVFKRIVAASKERKCVKCKGTLPKNDNHFKCYICLGPYHAIPECGQCSVLPEDQIIKRKKAQMHFIKTKTWLALDEFDDSTASLASYKTTVTHVLQSGPEDQDQQQVQNQNESEDIQGRVVLESNDIQMVGESGPVENPSEGETSQQEDRDEMNRKFQAFLASQPESETINPRKRPMPLPTFSKKQRRSLDEEPQFVQLQSQVTNLDSKMDLILNALNPSASTPILNPQHKTGVQMGRGGAIPKIPKRPVRETLTLQDLDQPLSQEGFEDEESYTEDPWAPSEQEEPTQELLSRKASRDIWLSGLRELVPKVPLVPATDTGEKQFFKTLKTRKQKPTMPFLQDVLDVCTEAEMKKQGNVWGIEKLYTTVDSAEQQVLTPKDVPYALAREVPPKHLKELGLKEDVNRLAPKTNLGLQEKFALESSRFAGLYLRIANSFQLALSAMETLLERCTLKAELLNSKGFVDDQDKKEVQDTVSDLIDDFNLLSLSVSDASFSNGDFLEVAAAQYSQASKSRTEAWVEATALPKSVKKQLINFDPDVSKKGSKQHLKVLSSDAESFLRTFTQNRKEQEERNLVLKSLKANPQKTQQQQVQKQQQQTQYKSPLESQFQEFLKAQNSWSNRGKGSSRGRGNRGGKGQRGRGKGPSRPFPKGKKQNQQ